MSRKTPTFESASRIVIKTGSALVTDSVTGQPRQQWMASFARDVAELRAQGKTVILVSSGAVALGRNILGLKGRMPLRLDEKQAAAACGQVAMMEAWQAQFATHELKVAQILLTLDISEYRNRYLNARNTLETLLEMGVIPIVNENDTIATAELRFGDNDRLAARVAEMAGADTLVIFSDIDGFYTADPTRNPDAKLMPLVTEITPEIEKMAGKPVSGVGTGGMATKLQAAKIAQAAGCHMLIAAGKPEHPISRVRTQGGGTWFMATATPVTARKRWIAGSINPTGSIIIDDGAVKALRSGKSLLAAGVTQVDGAFDRGEAVLVKDNQGQILAKGLITYTAYEAQLLKGRKSEEFESLIGYKGRNVLIHRDDLVIAS